MMVHAADIPPMLAARLRALRLARGLTQAGLARRAGVSLGSLRLFETSGRIALASLAKLAYALDRERDFVQLFEPPPLTSLTQLREDRQRQRGSIT